MYVLVGQVAADSGGAVWAPLIAALCLALLTAASYAEFVTLPLALVPALFLAALALLNARGISESTRANVVATVIEVGGLLLVIGLGCWIVLRGEGNPVRLTDLGTASEGPVAALFSGAVLASYSFVGFETSVNVAEETLDPRRSYPRALFGALITAGAVYALVGAAAAAARTDRETGRVERAPARSRPGGGRGPHRTLQRYRPGGRRQRSPHFRAPTAVPVLGAASCVLLATQVERDVWIRGLIVLAVGAVLGAVAAVRLRREG
ncbi:amino acid permease [Streptomyces sp. NPDC051561]|uniref:amino acid permease n=1 Tax=Streptomyces sp. NPDC051561 TaxID=3365658 RepID=UPI0037A660FD